MTTVAPTPSLPDQCLVESPGTALLVFLGVGYVATLKVANVSFGLWEINIIWGVDVSVAIYLSAGVSGARLNPTVNIVLRLFAGFKGRGLPFYTTAQAAGAFCAAALIYTLYNSLFIEFEQAQNIVRSSQDSLALASTFSAYPHPALSVGQTFLVEVVTTAILTTVVMALTDDGNSLPHGPLTSLLIGLPIAVIGSAMGPLTGFVMNPAHDFGPKLMTYLASWEPITFTGDRRIPYLLMPIFAPIFDACLGAGGYRVPIARHLPSAAASAEAEPEKVYAS